MAGPDDEQEHDGSPARKCVRRIDKKDNQRKLNSDATNLPVSPHRKYETHNSDMTPDIKGAH